MKIIHKNKEYSTKYFDGVVDKDVVKEMREVYYSEDKEEALKQLKRVLNNQSFALNRVNGYYFDRITNDGRYWHNRWSINEVFESDEILQSIYNRTLINKKVFYGSLKSNIDKVLSIGGKGLSTRLSRFPLKEGVRVLDTYRKDSNTFIDPCCGWGTRMIASALLNMEYIGFEVNKPLVERLEELGKDIQTIKPDFKFKIYKQGSQYYVPELENKTKIIFTSPPYFNLEIYGNNEFEKEDSLNGDYSKWLDKFVQPMLENCLKYACEDSTVLMNVKNYKDYTIVEDFIRIGKKVGFEHIGFDTLKNINRRNSEGSTYDNSELIIVFKK